MDGINSYAAPQPIEAIDPFIIIEDEIEKFLYFLAGASSDKEVFTFCFLDSDSEKSIKGYGCVHAKCQEIIEIVNELKLKHIKFTLHVVLNRTNLKGSKIKDIISARVLCLDLDTEISLEKCKELLTTTCPGMIVESSPGKYHLYWRVDTGLGLPNWSKLQLGLAGLFHGDLNLAQIQHTIRVPGIERIKNDKKLIPKIIYLDPNASELSYNEICTRFPSIIEEGLKAKETQKQAYREIALSIRANQSGDKIILNSSPKLGRNNYLFAYLKAWMIGGIHEELTAETLLAEANRINQQFTPPLGEEEISSITRKLLPKGIADIQKKAENLKKRQEVIDSVLVKQELPQNGHGSNGESGVKIEGADKPINTGKKKRWVGFDYDFNNDLELKLAPYSDLGVFRRVIQRYGYIFRNTGNIVHGFELTDRLWRSQKYLRDILLGSVSSVTRDMVQEDDFYALFCLTEEGKMSEKLETKAKARFLSNYLISSTVNRLIHCKEIQKISIADFDFNPEKLHLYNGLLDLTTLQIRDATPEDLLLKRSTTLWKGIDCPCPGWEQFIAEVFAENEEPDKMVEFIQDLFGYTLSGHMDVQKVYIHYGEGSNGKSKVLGALAAILGDYSTLMGCSTLSRGKNAVAKELERIGVKMEGKRMVLIDDLDTNTQWNEGLVKMLTGRKIPARNLYEEERDIPNRAKFHIGCNTAPNPEGENFGLLRRLCIIPYPRQFEQSEKKESEIIEMIANELSGILAWAVKGYKRYQTRGLVFPEEIKASLEEYKAEHFTIEKLVKELFVGPDTLNPGEQVSLPDLVAEVNTLLASKGSHEIATPDAVGKALSRMLKVKAVRIRVGNGERVKAYQLVRLKSMPDLLT